MAAGLDDVGRERLRRQGIETLAPEEGLDAFERIVGVEAAYVAVMPMDWSRHAESRSAGRLTPLFIEVVAARPTATTAADGPSGVLQALAAAAPNRRRAVLLGHVHEQAVKILGLGAGRQIDPRQPLQELGMDSLMAVELRNALGAALARTLPATLLFDFPTLDDLADHLLPQLGPEQGDAPVAPTVNAPSDADVADVARLSEEEAEAMLLAELSALKGKTYHG
jgi:acyl carrier protein